MTLPVKIMFGDGVSWCAMTSFDIVETDKGMVMTNQTILDLLEKLPIVYGLGIKADVLSVETYIFCNAPEALSLPVVVRREFAPSG